MKAYQFDERARTIIENSVVPIGIYQVIDGHVVTLIASKGLCALFDYKSRAEAVEKMDGDMYWNVHPEDLDRVEAVAAGFILEDKPYNLVCRVKVAGGYRLIHTRGEHIVTETGERLAVVWYIDEGSVVLDAKLAEDEEKIVELKALVASLFNNMPALSFSKDTVTGAYLACNQAFADYAGKATPAEAVGLTDYDIFDSATAARFVADDKKAMAMDAPYIYSEDAPDARGRLRRFQTTKLKFVDSTGRLCLLGMCMDLTEVTRIRKENEQARTAYAEALSARAIYQSIVNALSQDFFDLYYVDVETGDYIEYGPRTWEGERENGLRGEDFFADAGENARRHVCQEDRERFTAALKKETLLGEIERHGTFMFYYRLLLDGVPTYVSLKATRIPGDDRHIIIGVSNVDAQVRDSQAARRAEEDKKSYLRLSALNRNLIVLYFVDPADGHYTQYSASRHSEDLGLASQGTDFFQSVYESSLRAVHPEDRAQFQAQATRKNILDTIRRDGMFVLDYRMMSGALPTYVRLKAALIEESGKPMLIVGLQDEDVQIRQEQEYARKLSAARTLATIDPLTGVKNKLAYAQWEKRINAEIGKGLQPPFAVVVCDINNLKVVNDVYGHQEGDDYIKRACMRICRVFAHSPVFRIGGDEFVALLTGEDYDRRSLLTERISAVGKGSANGQSDGIIAAGMVEYSPGRHMSLQSVFEEADKAMYDKKQLQKESSPAEEPLQAAEGAAEDIPVIHARKSILIADDIEMNREILGDLLGEDYDIFYAADGVEALEVLRRHREDIALVLLDLQMPNMTGREVIARMQVDEDLMSIPVIFLTVDQDAELDCLRIGAMDFIPKPLPDIEIVKARIAKCIELSEDRDLIRHTERDRLTGLLNKEYFFRYVNRLDHIYCGMALDAIACDVNRFHSVNKQFGRIFGDRALRSIGVGIRRLARRTGGISCRLEGDTFLLYCPRQKDYEGLLGAFARGVLSEDTLKDNISLRFGVFEDARREPDIEERFVRAKAAADGVKGDIRTICGHYAE